MPYPARLPVLCVHHNQTLGLDSLKDEAAAALEEKGVTQADVAEALDLSRATVSRALSKSTGTRYEKALRRIVAEYTPFKVDGEPEVVYRVVFKDAQ